ncbi:Uncharacterized protein AC517_0553 [Pseudomonas syringae pv. syringae]|nr:Uncharacterized protein AC517_0553 [Pseudomonas syringae pv. syringae]
MEQRPDILLVETKPALCGREQTGHVAMLDHYALGQAGRTGGVDDVRQVARAEPGQLWIVTRLGLQRRTVQIHAWAIERAQQRQPCSIGQHRHRCAVLHLVGDTLGRIGRVNRHVTGTGLEHPEQTDDHFQAALDTDRYPVIWLHAQAQQIMGHLIGASVQLGIGQGAVFVMQGHGIRLRHHPGFEGTVNQGVVGLQGMRSVPAFQQLLALDRGQDIQRSQRSVRGLFQCLHQIFQHTVHVGTHTFGTDLPFGHDGQGETFAQIIHAQGQRVVGAFFAMQRLNAFPGDQRLVTCVEITGMAKVEQRAEQWRRSGYTTATLGQYQRGVLMGQQPAESCVGGFQTAAHALLAQRDTQRQGVDEHPQRPVRPGTALQTTEQYGAEHHIVLAGCSAQYTGPGQVIKAGGADPELSGLHAQAAAQVDVDHLAYFLDTASVALHVLQAEWQRRLIDVTEHVVEKRLVLFTADTEHCLGHVVAIRHGRWQRGLLPEHVRLDFTGENAQRGGIVHQVMEQQHAQPAIIRRVLCIADTQHRRLTDVQTRVTRVQALDQLFGDVAFGRVQHLLIQAQSCLTPDHLHGCVETLPKHRGAQDIVAGDHALQGLSETVQPLEAVKGKQCILQVRVTFDCGKVVIQNPLLQRCQGIDVLHVGQAAGHACHHAVDIVLAQRHQRQHVRGDALTAGGNKVSGGFYSTLPAHCGRQGRQGRLAEQHAHIGNQIDLAHALDQFHGQQRVAAQLKEIVMTTNLLQLQQVLPDTRNGHLGIVFRCFIAATGHRRAVGCWQSLAVELAVGRQRETFQADKGAWQHVLGQRQAQLLAQLRSVRFQSRRTDDVGHQTLVTGLVLTHQHQRILYSVTRGQLCFDLAQFDTETANLDLFVVTAQVFQAAIGQPAPEVAGAIQSRIRRSAERVIKKALCRQCFAAQIAPCHTCPAHVQLADHAYRHRFAMNIEQIKLQVRDAFADRACTDALCVFRSQRVIGHMHRGFGNAVHVYQLCTGIHVTGVPRLEHRRFQRFTTENHLTQRMRLRVLALGSNQLPERARRLVEHRYPSAA